jgi:dephospho-CoA kinase
MDVKVNFPCYSPAFEVNGLDKLKGKGEVMLLAVTGGIATGKSTVSRILEELGAPLIDFDLLARQVVEPGKPAWKAIMDYFGKEVIQEDGRIDRKRLSEVVFQDVEKRKKLEGITHPRIFEEFDRQVKEIASKDPDAIIQAGIPLLIELDLQPRFDQVLVVYAPQETQIDRLMKRDRISREAAKNILKAQMPIDEKLRLADFVIHNEGSLEETRKQVEAVWQELKKMRKKNTEARSQEPGVRRQETGDRIENNN